ncbi:SDR family NAD(P)-dependent oxidoreductase [Allosaccharopolyspora coralli]|uniref:SDR family NAD(P)-dependent oxidoreductase n=1 Tax=Allosaccharopolyspora coralli TaxID=2665642 RepID=A0A5Q3Q801_9PSEU|nr:SDR family NAD(P)-dependent oxidoreductase [Allosaccharopolyspora coralli]QGK70612.1 SDR family NAD(P)-dependent oxidoreductase [Allosaccharopolyspora coralli]
MSRTALVLGGRSEIGTEVARRLVADGVTTIVLAARRSDDLGPQVDELRAAGATAVSAVEFDADQTGEHAAFLDRVEAAHGPVDDVVLAFGILGDQQRAETDAAHAVAVVHTDYVAQVSMLTLLAARMRRRGSGRLVAFSSIAGVRVRRANYVYGSAKAGLDGFASGLADALHGSAVHLLLVRPGFVVGRMTEGMSPAPLSTTPEKVAEAATAALRRGRGEVWVPGRLRLLAAAFRLMPRAIWRRMPR